LPKSHSLIKNYESKATMKVKTYTCLKNSSKPYKWNLSTKMNRCNCKIKVITRKIKPRYLTKHKKCKSKNRH
jgi:hypothetical protein